jgi:hypothetical protein
MLILTKIKFFWITSEHPKICYNFRGRLLWWRAATELETAKWEVGRHIHSH